jgi:hypothetical protein
LLEAEESTKREGFAWMKVASEAGYEFFYIQLKWAEAEARRRNPELLKLMR